MGSQQQLHYQPMFAETTGARPATVGVQQGVGVGTGSHQQSSFLEGLPEPAFLPILMQPPHPSFTYANCQEAGCRMLKSDSNSGYSMLYTPSYASESLPLSQQFAAPMPVAVQQQQQLLLSPTYYPTDGLAAAASGGHALQQQTPLLTAYASQMELPPPSRCVFAFPASSAVSRE